MPSRVQLTLAAGLSAVTVAAMLVAGTTGAGAAPAPGKLNWDAVHALVWHSRMPARVQYLTTADWARAELLNHISTVVGHLRGQVGTWDVVDEAFSDNGTRRNLVFQARLGDGWIGEASAKSNTVYDLVRNLVASGVPIDCVGFESHFRPGTPVPATFRANLQRFADLGVDVELTELDVAGTAITVSTIRDKDSFSGYDGPGLFDNNGAPKLAYGAVLAALNAAAPGSTATTTTTTTTLSLMAALPLIGSPRC